MGGAVSSRASAPAAAAARIVDGEAAVLERAGALLLARPTQAARVRQRLATVPVVAVLAKSGTGKSTFVAQLVRELRSGVSGDGARFDVVHVVFVGAAEGSTSLFRVLGALCAALAADHAAAAAAAKARAADAGEGCGGYGWKEEEAAAALAAAAAAPPHDLLGLSGLLERLLQALCAPGPLARRVLLCVDALNELEGGAARALGWLPARVPAGCSLLLTSISGGDNGGDADVADVLAALQRRYGLAPSPPAFHARGM